MKINADLLTSLKMSTNPPKEVVDAGYSVIADGWVKTWVGRGWVSEHIALKRDYELFPEVEFK